jgi:hypothetical protein
MKKTDGLVSAYLTVNPKGQQNWQSKFAAGGRSSTSCSCSLFLCQFLFL